MISIKNCDPKLLSMDQVSFKNTDFVIYNIEYITMESLGGANSLYLVFNNVDVYTEENNENKYLVFSSTDENKEALENYTELWDESKDQIELISVNKPIEYKKDFMIIRFESDDNLPLGKLLNISVCIIVARSVFQGNNNYYPQAFLHECFHECEYDSYSIV